MYIAVNEWPKENVVRLISRNFVFVFGFIYLFIISNTYSYCFYLDRNFNEAYFLPTKLRLRMCLRNV